MDTFLSCIYEAVLHSSMEEFANIFSRNLNFLVTSLMKVNKENVMGKGSQSSKLDTTIAGTVKHKVKFQRIT